MTDTEAASVVTSGGGEGEWSSETTRILHQRVSVRRYADRPVPDEAVDAVLRAAFRAPTSSNIQAYSVVAVRERETCRRLSVVTANQVHVAETPVFLAFCADISRMESALSRHGHDLDDNNLELGLVSSVDAALVGMSAYLAAESLGLQGVMIGAVRNDPVEVAGILGLPRRVFCVFGMCLGWPDEAPPQKPRMPYEAMVHRERYGTHRDGLDAESALEAYDAELASHYRATGRKTTDRSWTDQIDQTFAAPRRDNLREALRARGFDFR